MIEDHGKSWLKQFLAKRKEKLINKHLESLRKIKNLKGRFESIAKIQDEAGYMARVEYENGLPMLEEFNCPFIEVAKKYPEFCEAEREVYEKVLGRSVKLKGCRARGANVCRFCIVEEKGEN